MLTDLGEVSWWVILMLGVAGLIVQYGLQIKEYFRERPMLIFIACGALIGGAAGALIWWGIISQRPLPTLSREERAAIQRGDLAYGVLLSRKRLSTIDDFISHLPDPSNFRSTGHGSEALPQMPDTLTAWWLSKYDDFGGRYSAALKRENILPEAELPEQKLRKRVIANQCLRAHYEAVRGALLGASELQDRQV